MAKKIKKYVDGGDVYEGTPLARAMGVRGVAEPGLEEVYPEQYMGGVGSIKGVGGSAMKAVAPKGSSLLQKQISRLEDTIANNPDRIAGGIEAGKTRLQKLKDTADKYSEARQQMGRAEAMKTKSAHLINKSYKKGGAVKSSASKRADGIATKGKTKGRII